MQFPDGTSAGDFLVKHWQQSAAFLPGALSNASPVLAAEELAWLATLDDVESRLIFTERTGSRTSYRLEHGPFDDVTLRSLPERDWTLLVHDVEKHLPDFRQWLAYCDFIPDWRIDDLMISFAAPGGSVGPHKDNYDVFLCQTSGRREWRLADATAPIGASTSESLSLLEPFGDPAPLIAADGDVLYLPPGVPHWGIALDACMTYSIGMRAPSVAELRCGFERAYPCDLNPFSGSQSDQDRFYRDAAPAADESAPGEISASSVQRCRDLISGGCPVSDRALAIALGVVVTDLKAWLQPDGWTDDEIADVENSQASLPVHGMARVAWHTFPESGVVFANGEYRLLSPTELVLIRQMCADRSIDGQTLQMHFNGELLRWLLKLGVFAHI